MKTEIANSRALAEAEFNGREACFNGDFIAANPYAALARAWEVGFRDASTVRDEWETANMQRARA